MVHEIIHLLDKHTSANFLLKIACLYFGSNSFRVAVKWLNQIINEPDTGLREDLHSFARILRLICYFEMGDAEMIEMNTRATYRFLLRKKNLENTKNTFSNFYVKCKMYILPKK
ncbi:MAG: hypothetical protein IPO32_06215 [Crocinitomicaceae bacterium]|nr:hypothetical protein [Crocinitomicaceae bacterium]